MNYLDTLISIVSLSLMGVALFLAIRKAVACRRGAQWWLAVVAMLFLTADRVSMTVGVVGHHPNVEAVLSNPVISLVAAIALVFFFIVQENADDKVEVKFHATSKRLNGNGING